MFTLITGASSGIGYQFAIDFLKRGYDIVMVSRSPEKSAKKLRVKFPNRKIIYYSIDLSDLDNLKSFLVNIENINFDFIINNAGFGTSSLVINTEINTEINMVKLNVIALQYITEYFIHHYSKLNKNLKIVNISSIVGYFSGPTMSTYFATKNYVSSYSTALDYELKKNNSKIRVITVCPGATKTNFANVAGMDKKRFSDIAMPVDLFVGKVMNKILVSNPKSVILIGFTNKLIPALSKLLPLRFALALIYKVNQ